VACGTCEHDFNDHEDISTLHFDSVQAAIQTLTEVGWLVTATGIQCGACASYETCAIEGHDWPDWHDCGCGCHRDTPRILAHTQPMRTRWCHRCGREWQEQPA
jgi:hypothetical protein